jgi:hypothetical protein
MICLIQVYAFYIHEYKAYRKHEIPRKLEAKVSSPEALYMNSRNAISLFLEKCLEMLNKFVINVA